MNKYLHMLDEFLYYETIPDCHKESIKELIAKIKSSNSDYAKCLEELLDYLDTDKMSLGGRTITNIFKKHFA